MGFILTVIIGTATLLGFGTHPVSYNGITITVEDHIGGTWDSALGSSIHFVDRYTSSRMRRGHCPRKPDSHCIIIRHGNVRNINGQDTVGRTEHNGWMVYITVETKVHGYYPQRALLDHELGHAFWLGHNTKCTSRMYHNIRCNGHLSPRTFTKAEIKTLHQY